MDIGTVIALVGLGAFVALLVFFYFHDRKGSSRRSGSLSDGEQWTRGVHRSPESGTYDSDSGGGGGA